MIAEKKRAIVVRAMAVVALVFSTISVSAANPRTKVGVIVPLTGANAATGAAIKNGIELARRDHPDILGNVEFLYEDDGFDPKRDIAALNRLMTGERPDVLFGLGPNLVEVLAAKLEREQIPLINFGFVSGPTVGKPLVVRTMNHTDQYMKALADYLQRDGVKEFPVVIGEHAFFRAMADSLIEGFGNERMVRVIANPTPDEVDFRSVILKLREYRNTKVGVLLFTPSLIAFIKQARDLGIAATFFGTDQCEAAVTQSGNPRLLEGCLYPDNDPSEDFRSAYLKRFGDGSALTFAANAYDMTMLIGEVLRNKGKQNAAEIMRTLAQVKERKGELGTFSYIDSAEHGRFFEYPVRVMRIEDGRGVPVQ